MERRKSASNNRGALSPPPAPEAQEQRRYSYGYMDAPTSQKSLAALSLLEDTESLKGREVAGLTTPNRNVQLAVEEGDDEKEDSNPPGLSPPQQGTTPNAMALLASHELMKYQETHAFLSSGAQYTAPKSPGRGRRVIPTSAVVKDLPSPPDNSGTGAIRRTRRSEEKKEEIMANTTGASNGKHPSKSHGALSRDEFMKEQEKNSRIASLPDPNRVNAANMALRSSSNVSDHQIKEQAKQQMSLSSSKKPSSVSNLDSSKNSHTSRRSRFSATAARLLNNSNPSVTSSIREDESLQFSQNLDFSSNSHVPRAPMEKKDAKGCYYGKDDDEELDLMKIVSERSATAAMEEGIEVVSTMNMDRSGFHDSRGILTDDSYYVSNDGHDEDECERRNIKQAAKCNNLPSMPGAYAGAPGADLRRVRSIRYGDVGQFSSDDDCSSYYYDCEDDDNNSYSGHRNGEGRKLSHATYNSGGDSKELKISPSKESKSSSGGGGVSSSIVRKSDKQHKMTSDDNSNHDMASRKKKSDTYGVPSGMEKADRTASTLGLVEARAVLEDEEAQERNNVVGEANVYHGPTDAEKERERKAHEQQLKCVATLFFCVVVPFITVTFLFGLGILDKQPETIATEFPSIGPTGSPTFAPTAYSLSLPEFSVQAIRNDSNSPQAKAYNWIRQDPNLQEYSNEQLQQRFALAAFYYGANGESWTLNDGWLSYNVGECNWYSKWINTGEGGGVCDEDGNFLLLLLTLNGLSGSLVPEISLLTNLERLDVASNKVGGTLPTALGLMTELKELTLDVNVFYGPLPTEVGLIQNLEILLVHSNGLTGPVPSQVGQLTQLKDFEAGNAELSGSLPSQLGLMTSLNTLTFNNNNLNGTIPLQLWNLTNLSHVLQLNENAFTGTLASNVGHLSNLEYLRIYGTQLNGSIPSELGAMTSITHLDLCCGYFGQNLPSELGQLTNANTIYLENNLFTGSIPSDLGNAEKLRLLTLGTNQLTGSIPSELSNLHELDQLFLYKNTLTGPIPSEFGLLDTLTTLDIEINLLSSSIPTELFQMKSIEVLWLGNNWDLSSTIPSEIGHVSSTLTKFAVDWTSVYGFLPTEIGMLSVLKNLHLHFTTILGPLRSELGMLASLQQLTLDSAFFLGTIPLEMENLNRLEVFTLTETFLSGTVPPDLCGVPALQFNCSDLLCGCYCACVVS